MSYILWKRHPKGSVNINAIFVKYQSGLSEPDGLENINATTIPG